MVIIPKTTSKSELSGALARSHVFMLCRDQTGHRVSVEVALCLRDGTLTHYRQCGWRVKHALSSVLTFLQVFWFHYEAPSRPQVRLPRVRVGRLHQSCCRVSRVSSFLLRKSQVKIISMFLSEKCHCNQWWKRLKYMFLFCSKAFQLYYKEFVEASCPTEDIYLE